MHVFRLGFIDLRSSNNVGFVNIVCNYKQTQVRAVVIGERLVKQRPSYSI